jgi:hypothetical protein
MPLRDLARGDRRFEAETYLSSGYGLRLAIERQRYWRPLNELAVTWQPLRLKGIQVGPDGGTPFLAATQVFDIRPVPRKWLALGRTERAASRFVTPGQILVTCSGAVGRATLAYAPHEGTLISHDLLRVDAREPTQRGWLYAYLRAPQTRAMMSGAQYGHIIKHLETAHLDALPVPEIDAAMAEDFERRVSLLLECRNRSYAQTLEAERLFGRAVGLFEIDDTGENGFSTRASRLMRGRRRLEGAYFNPMVERIHAHLRQCGTTTPLSELGFAVWLPTRFKRIPAEDGIWFLDSSDIFECSPDVTKRIADGNFGDATNGRVKAGWLLVARSGQVYGINGSCVLADSQIEGKIISDHVIRIAPKESCSVRMGYVHTVMSHPLFGRPLVKALAYGSSIPEIDPTDLAAFPIVRLDRAVEEEIAEFAESSALARAKADALESELSKDAGRIIERFIAGTPLRPSSV